MSLDRGAKLGPYQILDPLGAGGMGEVYKARDTRLHRDVAIKILPERLAGDPQALARFDGEARALAALSHPNILSLYDIGADQGVSFAVTELLEGETLRSRLRRGALPWREAVETGVALAGGLAAAHSKSIIHRDLKPENIFLTSDGRVKILDFGLAKWRSTAAPQDETCELTQTAPGTVLGTVGYMSPEQVRGGAAGATSDIFSMGCVLYEMVAGRRAFDGPSAADRMSAVLKEQPIPLAAAGKPVPPELEQAIGRCLEKSVEKRFQSAQDVSSALKDILGGSASLRAAPGPSTRRIRAIGWIAAVLAAVAAVSFYWISRPARTIDSLAVLPFVNANTDPNAEYLCDGISETLITHLSRVPGLKVKSRDSVFRYKGKDVRTAGRELGVRAVLKGRIAQRDDDLSIAVELVDARDNNLIWRDQYHRKMADILATEEEIAREICDKLRFKLTGEEQKRVGRRSTGDAEAHQLYLKGRYAWDRRSEENLKKSLEYFKQAIDKDPGYALAWAGLADSYNMLAAWGVSPRADTYPRARAAAERALELDNSLAEAVATLARVKTEYEWDWAGAEREYKRAIKLNANWGTAHQWYAVHLAAVGRPQEALAEARRAREAEPLSPVLNANVGWFYYIARQYDQAAEECRKLTELEPNYAWGHNCLGSVYLQTGRRQEAVAEFQQSLTLSKRGVIELTYLGHAHAVSGARAEVQKILDELKDLSARRYVPPEYLAFVYGGLGDKDRAFEWFERGFAARSMHAWFLPDPRLDPLRSDPRFKDLMRRMGLPQLQAAR